VCTLILVINRAYGMRHVAETRSLTDGNSLLKYSYLWVLGNVNVYITAMWVV